MENEARCCPVLLPMAAFSISSVQDLSSKFWLLWQCSGLFGSKAAAVNSQISLQTGTLTLGAVGTSRATRRRTADNLKPDRLSPSLKI